MSKLRFSRKARYAQKGGNSEAQNWLNRLQRNDFYNGEKWKTQNFPTFLSEEDSDMHEILKSATINETRLIEYGKHANFIMNMITRGDRVTGYRSFDDAIQILIGKTSMRYKKRLEWLLFIENELRSRIDESPITDIKNYPLYLWGLMSASLRYEKDPLEPIASLNKVS